MFPNAKFIMMIRDGRGNIHSLYKRAIYGTLDEVDCPILDPAGTYLPMNSTMKPNSKYFQLMESINNTLAYNFSEGQMECMRTWNRGMASMFQQCMFLGPKRCYTIYYEKFVYTPYSEIYRMIKFLNLPFHINMFQHHKHFGKEILARLVM